MFLHVLLFNEMTMTIYNDFDEKVIEELRTLQIEQPQNLGGFTTQEVASRLGYDRSYVSSSLNRLTSSGMVLKKSGHPALFSLPMIQCELQDPFDTVIGKNGSFKDIIDTCKASVLYPPNGLSLLISGESGTGKTFLAERIYRFAIYKKQIAIDSPFIIVNCSEYANNPELLSAHLFGYVKGAFTGAINDKQGMLELADGGYIFLDEVHRLSPENQEKLFRFIDYGEFKRLGDNDIIRKANVRFIYATSEKPNAVLLNTLLRRISLTLELPDFISRPKVERNNYISYFFTLESQRLGKDLFIEPQLFNDLVDSPLSGNIGGLNKIIQRYCALSWEKQENASRIIISKNVKNKFTPAIPVQHIGVRNEYITIAHNSNFICSIPDIPIKHHIDIYDLKHRLEKIFQGKDDFYSLKNLFNVENLSDSYFYSEDDFLNVTFNLFFEKCHELLQQYGMSVKVDKLRDLFIVLQIYIVENGECIDKIMKSNWLLLRRIDGDICLVAEKLALLVLPLFEFKNEVWIKTFISLFLAIEFSAISVKKCSAIIVAHGASTAKSIAGFTNQMYQQFVYNYLDMPLNVSPDEISEKVKKYISQFANDRKIIILVDMGSLYELRKPLINFIENDFGIINNISTSIALEVAGYITENWEPKDIVERIRSSGEIKSEFYRKENKDHAILISFFNAFELAEKIKSIINESLVNTSIKAISIPFDELLKEGVEHHLFQEYDARILITNHDIAFSDVNVLMLDEIINGIDNGLLDNVFSVVANKQKIQIKQNIMQSLSMENLSDRLTILNPKKIVNDVNKVLNEIEFLLDIELPARIKVTLFLHVSVMIERVLLSKYEINHNVTSSGDLGGKFNIIKKSLLNLERAYNITIPDYEINYIVDMIYTI